LVTWPQVDTDGRPVMLLDTESTLAMDPEATTTKFWAAAGHVVR
jgi:hypothetical protein